MAETSNLKIAELLIHAIGQTALSATTMAIISPRLLIN
jgi:hypothetical protein